MYYASLDVGQSEDPSAFVMLEKFTKNLRGTCECGKRSVQVYQKVVYLERFDLGTSYTVMVDRVVDMCRSAWLKAEPMLIMDITGVGRPVYDMFKRTGLKVVGVSITNGLEEKSAPYGYTVPKRELVSTVKSLLDERALLFADDLPDLDLLKGELFAFRSKVTAAGNDTYSAWRESQHDDIVLATAIGLWYSERYGISDFPKPKKDEGPFERYMRLDKHARF